MDNRSLFMRCIMFALLACLGSGVSAVASDDDFEIYDGIKALFSPIDPEHDFELQAFRHGLIDHYHGDDYNADHGESACPPDECSLYISNFYREGKAGYEVSCTQCKGIMAYGFYEDFNDNTSCDKKTRGAELLCTLTKLHLRIIDQRSKNSQ